MVYPCQAAAWLGSKDRILSERLEEKDDKSPDHHGRKANRNLSKAIRLRRSGIDKQRGFALRAERPKAPAINGKIL